MEKRYSIIFSSLTGNTRKLADQIHKVLPAETCDYFGEAKEGGTIFGGSLCWLLDDKGNADGDSLKLLASLRNKKIFLFGTAGFGVDEAYYRRILTNVKQSIDSSNTVIGEYMCQGKMPMAVRERYVKLKEQPEYPANLDVLIENFDRALSHPDKDDLDKLRNIVLS